MPLRTPRKPTRSAPREPVESPVEFEGADEFNEVAIQEWLEPIGNTGFYQSPLEPVDPYDCDRWPDSPFCEGSQPFNTDFIDLVPIVTRNACETCITLAPTLARLSLPPYTICKRSPSPECIPRVEPPPETPQPGTPSPYQKYCADGSYHYIGHTQGVMIDGQTFPPDTDYNTIAKAVFDSELAKLQEEYGTELPWRTACSFSPDLPFTTDRRGMSSSYQGIKVLNGQKTYYDLDYPDVMISGANWVAHFTYKGEYAYLGKGSFTTGLTSSSITYFNAPNCDQLPDPGVPAPAPPYHPQEWCCMACCESHNENTELLRLIAKRLGTDQYPASVPKSLLTDKGSGQQEIESLTQLIGWFVNQVDGLVGQFPVEIEITDSDPTKKGDQKEKVVVPNIAEAIAEMYGLALKNSVDSDVAVSFLMRLASEVIATKNSSLITQDYVRANAQFLGYKGNNVKRRIPYAFNPEGLDSLETILQESSKFIVGWEATNDDTLLEFQQRLMFAAGIIKAVFFRGQNNLENLKREVTNIVDRPGEEDGDERWREYLRAINNSNHRFNTGNVPKPKIKDLQTPEDITKLPTQDPSQK